MRISDWSSDVCSSDLIEYFRSKRFTSRISDPPKVAPRPIAINAVSSAAKLAGEASSSDPLAQALSAKRAALLNDGQATAPAERTEPVMRALTGDELSGFADQLSYGGRRRVEFARALAMRPR